MTEADVVALMRGLAPVLRERFAAFDESVKEQLAGRDQAIDQLKRRVADLEDEATRP